MSLLAENTLWMKLHALEIEDAVANAHNLPFSLRAVTSKHSGSVSGSISRGVVAGHRKRVIQSKEHPLTGMADRGRFPVHHFRGSYDRGAENPGNRLMACANA